MGVSDRIVVMNYGRKLAEGPTDEIRNDPDVIAAYGRIEVFHGVSLMLRRPRSCLYDRDRQDLPFQPIKDDPRVQEVFLGGGESGEGIEQRIRLMAGKYRVA